MNLTFILLGPLLLASFVLCVREGKNWWSLDTPLRGYDSATRRQLAKFLWSGKAVPEPDLAPVAVEWAEDVINRHCRWHHYLLWAWVLWTALGTVAAVAFETLRDVATQLIVFDAMFLVAVSYGRILRRAHGVLDAVGSQ